MRREFDSRIPHMSSLFKKNEENFICDQCGTEVRGTGYTNHCPECLWSKHVDINPGDRASTCGGAMRPVGYRTHEGNYELIHRCEGCGYEKPNRVAAGDNLARLADLG